MPSSLVLTGMIAGLGRDAPVDDFLESVVTESPEVPTFRAVPAPGAIMAASGTDWRAVIGLGADLLAYAGALWTAYERYVKPRATQSEKRPPFVILNARRHDHVWVQLTMGLEYALKDDFISAFARQVSELRDSADGPDELELLWEFSECESWQRVEPEVHREHS